MSLLITDNWELKIASADLVDILDPLSVAVDGVGRQTDQLDSPSCELRLKLRKGTEFGGADWGEVFWVGKQNDPFVADELVEVNGTLSGLGIEIRGNGTQTEPDYLSAHRKW